ncbi:hypothetical protein ACFXDJ_15450 [Streptomyces sp. NPDC059443]|uniref:hypothetical protein n=1 Tax=unclassified Streptomyces TaxID=2593676 RepID=UPI0036BFEBE5
MDTPSVSPSPTAIDGWTVPRDDRADWHTKPRGLVTPGAEAIHGKSVKLINDLEPVWGSGAGSTCWPLHRYALSDSCLKTADKAEQTARTALSWITREPSNSFGTLRANAQDIVNATASYRAHGCAKEPTGVAARNACHTAGYTIAQTYITLREGFNAALEGR